MLENSFAWKFGSAKRCCVDAVVGAWLLLGLGCSGKLDLIDGQLNVQPGGDGSAGLTETGAEASHIEAAVHTEATAPDADHIEAAVDTGAATSDAAYIEAAVDTGAATSDAAYIEVAVYVEAAVFQEASTEVGPDAAQSCEAHADVQVVGICTTIFSWVVWDGGHCTRVGGSGCGCGGPDCAFTYDSESSCAAAHRDCYHATCEAQIASFDFLCESCQSEQYEAFWNGASCFELPMCDCKGEDCQNGFLSVAECEAAHSSCPASLCTATNGTWHPNSPCGSCGDYVCGIAPFNNCCDAGCDCGPGRRYDKTKGCIPEPSCTPEQTCAATGGAWVANPAECCVFKCGVASSCLDDGAGCTTGCNCGPHRLFDSALGCVADPSCNAPTEAVCLATGGKWRDGVCGHFICGFPTGDDCTSPGCDCGYNSNFDPALGCVYDPECHSLDYDHPCPAEGWCRPGLTCCDLPGFNGRCTVATNCSQEPCGA